MQKLWRGFKRFGNWCVILCICWWVVVWIGGSWEAGRFLWLDDLIPTADRWMGWK